MSTFTPCFLLYLFTCLRRIPVGQAPRYPRLKAKGGQAKRAPAA
jgi:hypothetical protein